MKVAEELGQPVELPELGPLAYVADAMIRLGPIRSNGMGQTSADWPEIDAFARATGRVSSGWEKEALYDMCASYLREINTGENPFCIPPMER